MSSHFHIGSWRYSHETDGIAMGDVEGWPKWALQTKREVEVKKCKPFFLSFCFGRKDILGSVIVL